MKQPCGDRTCANPSLYGAALPQPVARFFKVFHRRTLCRQVQDWKASPDCAKDEAGVASRAVERAGVCWHHLLLGPVQLQDRCVQEDSGCDGRGWSCSVGRWLWHRGWYILSALWLFVARLHRPCCGCYWFPARYERICDAPPLKGKGGNHRPPSYDWIVMNSWGDGWGENVSASALHLARSKAPLNSLCYCPQGLFRATDELILAADLYSVNVATDLPCAGKPSCQNGAYDGDCKCTCQKNWKSAVAGGPCTVHSLPSEPHCLRISLSHPTRRIATSRAMRLIADGAWRRCASTLAQMAARSTRLHARARARRASSETRVMTSSWQTGSRYRRLRGASQSSGRSVETGGSEMARWLAIRVCQHRTVNKLPAPRSR